MLEPAAQEAGELGSMRVGMGYHARPRNIAKVKSELTLTIPSSAITWIVVILILWPSRTDGDGAEEGGGENIYFGRNIALVLELMVASRD